MFYRARQRIDRLRFYRASKNILLRKGVSGGPEPVRVLSSVSHLDLYMYLVALKTFYRFVPYGRAIILDDGSLTADDKAILREHANPTDIIPLDEVEYRGGRKGVRWGILLTMAQLAERNFVIQLDSDTATIADLPQVVDAIQSNRAFTLGTGMGTEVIAAREIVQLMKDVPSDHVQAVAERNFDKLPGYESLNYIRGNSGLVGLGRGALSRSQAEDFLENMTQAIGPKWLERGSFQVSSNFVVANAPGAFVLPLNEYRYYMPGADMGAARFIHYIGTYRFVDNAYFNMARHCVETILA